MAIIKNGILGAFSGKAGTVVGFQLFGQDLMRSVPDIRTKPPTEKELANRRKFAVSQAWLQPITDLVRIGFQDYKPKCHGFVAAKSYLSKNALKGEDPDFYIDPELACISYGNLNPGISVSAVAGENYTIVFNWVNPEHCAYNDRVMVLAYDTENADAVYDTSIAKRIMGTATLQLDQSSIGKQFHLYIGFVSEDRKQRSISEYLGVVTII